MLEILQFYVSGFWIWAGITIACAFIIRAFIVFVAVVIAAIKGDKISVSFLDT